MLTAIKLQNYATNSGLGRMTATENLEMADDSDSANMNLECSHAGTSVLQNTPLKGDNRLTRGDVPVESIGESSAEASADRSQTQPHKK